MRLGLETNNTLKVNQNTLPSFKVRFLSIQGWKCSPETYKSRNSAKELQRGVIYAQLDTAAVQQIDQLRGKALCEEALLKQGRVPARVNQRFPNAKPGNVVV